MNRIPRTFSLQRGAGTALLIVVTCAVLLAWGFGMTRATDEPAPETTATPVAGATPEPDPYACLYSEAARGRLDPTLITALQEHGDIDALVTLDDAEVRALAEQRRIERELPFEDGAILAEKAAAYAAIKDRVLTAAGSDITVITDYELLPILHLAFAGPEPLCAVLAQPEVLAVEANRAFGPASPSSP